MSKPRPANKKAICINTPDSFPALSFVLGSKDKGPFNYRHFPEMRVYGYIKERGQTQVLDAIEFFWRDRDRGWLQSPVTERGKFSCYKPGKYEVEIALDFHGDQTVSTTVPQFILLDIYESRAPD